MAQFQADIEGTRGRASRLGTKTSGMLAVVRSWEGQVSVYLSHHDDVDHAYVTLEPHSSHGGSGRIVLYDGPCSGWRQAIKAA